MIDNLYKITKAYTAVKSKSDQKRIKDREKAKARYSPETLEKEIFPAIEAKYAHQNAMYKAVAIGQIEAIIGNARKWIDFCYEDFKPELLEEIDHLRGMGLSSHAEEVFAAKYRNNYYALWTFNQMRNERRDDLNKIIMPTLEDMTAEITRLESDVARIIATYEDQYDFNAPESKQNFIANQLATGKLANGSYKLDAPYLSEYQLTLPAPLLSFERDQITEYYKGKESYVSQSAVTKKLVAAGRGDLVYRSEYGKTLPEDWRDASPVMLSPAGEKLATGQITWGSYTGVTESYAMPYRDAEADKAAISETMKELNRLIQKPDFSAPGRMEYMNRDAGIGNREDAELFKDLQSIKNA